MLVGVQFDISAEAIVNALRGFQGNAEYNPMRNNLTHGHPYSLLESHCDGPEAIEELAKTAKSLCKGERRLVFCSAGNRRDEFIIAMGRAAEGFFHKYILTDWHDLRGRQPGETPALLRQGLIEAGVVEQQISIISDQRSAVRDAAARLSMNDLLCQNLG